MLDYKTTTFMTLCELMNYRKTAELLNMTQPGVTQHIHALEKEYGCRLFSYDGRSLSLTSQGKLLQSHLRKVRYDENWLRNEMKKQPLPELRIGATKSIGDYIVSEKIVSLISSGEYSVHLLVDNTQALLERINNGSLDLAMIEGEFDKQAYGWKLMRSEPFVGICHAESSLAGREVKFEEITPYRLLLREEGSGTRSIFENNLRIHGEELSSFSSTACISSFPVMKEVIAAGLGITFAYQFVAKNDPCLAVFYIADYPKTHDLYYVYLKNSRAGELLNLLSD